MNLRLKTLTLCSFLIYAAVCLHASITLFVEEPYGAFGAMNPTGHAAVYLNRICAETPVKLRPCQPGESGAVISRYYRVGGYDWAALPLIPYLYAVDRPEDVPLTADSDLVFKLRDQYRREHLRDFVPEGPDGDKPQGDWTQLVGASYKRKIYALEVETTAAQDEHLIEELNSGKNHSRFNLFFNNCADFAKKVINTDYPHAVRRSFSADMGLTTPKQLAKALMKYSKHHPELKLSIYEIPQVPGGVERSHAVRGVCESLVRTKKYAVPLVILHPWFTATFVAAYITGGRLDLAHDATPPPITAQQPPEVAAWLNARNTLEPAGDSVLKSALLPPTQ